MYTLDIMRESRYLLSLPKKIDRIENVANICFVAVWPWIAPGDVQTNYQWLCALTNGDYTLRSAIKGITTKIPELFQLYLSNPRNLL